MLKIRELKTTLEKLQAEGYCKIVLNQWKTIELADYILEINGNIADMKVFEATVEGGVLVTSIDESGAIGAYVFKVIK